jgi:hypothetical protein
VIYLNLEFENVLDAAENEKSVPRRCAGMTILFLRLKSVLDPVVRLATNKNDKPMSQNTVNARRAKK